MACGVPVISSDCRTGPREILAPDTDFNYQTNEPEFARYGVLMPVFEAKYKRANEPLDEVEKKWIDTLVELLENKQLREKYTIRSKERVKDFDIENIAKEWKSVLDA